MKVRKILATCIVLLVSSCASVSLEQMKKETQDYKLPLKPKKDNAIVYVTRPSGLGGLIKFNVFLDNKDDSSEMGYTLGTQYIYFFIAPGKHKIFSKAENWAEIEVDAKDGDQIFIKQIPSPGFIMARNKLEIIPEVEGKFYMIKAKNGGIKKLENSNSTK